MGVAEYISRTAIGSASDPSSHLRIAILETSEDDVIDAFVPTLGLRCQKRGAA
jgi:hypothetical protein